MKRWQDIVSAPRDGRAIRIRGRRFISDGRYTALAIWTTRKCPAEIAGWFPPADKADGQGPYLDATHWQTAESK